ncbi:type I restriction modification enzyme protein S [Marinomonas pontica]|uniref:Type I restriction modification enzyme protein S n=1 Tax=Marinomonas pontica TaxID=264739 RepID=A0ABM8FEJ1_9GAMM|nr:type I restriction modification enzyme protein S [Marinomonas pontica]
MSELMQAELKKQGQKWPMVSIKSVSTVVTGKTPSKKEADNFGGNIPFVTPVELGKEPYVYSSSQTITEKGAKAIKLVPKNSVLVCCIGSLGKTAIAGCEVGTNQQINSVIFDEGKVFPKYGYYALNRLKSLMVSLAPSTTVAIINKSNFEALEIPLPPLEEQKRIAAILDKADAIRRKRQQAIKLADEFLRSVFLDMFGDPVINPKGWEEKALLSLVIGKFQNGAYFPKEEYSDEGVEMVHMADAFYDVIQRGSLKRVLASDTDIAKYGLTYEDLMISRRSLNYEGAAKPSLIPNSDEPLIFESSMIRITPDKSQVDIRYLFQYLSDSLVKDHFIRKFVTGATIKGISQKNLEQVRILVPPMKLQRKFTDIVNKLAVTSIKLKVSEENTVDIFNGLSQKAFTGKL